MSSINNTKEEPCNDFNSEPVVYCSHCLSLKIMKLDDNVDFCDNCGSTDTETTDIESWKRLYENKYGKPF